MSGFMRKAALVVGAVALIAATAGAAAVALAPAGMAGAAGIGAVSAATLTAIGTYGGLAAGVLSAISVATAPKASAQGSATTFQTNPQSGLPYVMGRTRMSGLRSYAATNTRPGYTKFNDLLWFGALLSIGGQIEGIERFTADNELVTFDASGNAVGNYHDYQGQKIHLGGPQASALALSLGGGSAPGWTSQHRLSGITHAMWCLRYNKQGEMYGAGAPEPAWIGKWVKVYDPRLDSTYPGGSGPCRALTESTYVWSQNPGLHALTWALGRWQNGKRTCGIGAPVANIRVAEFVECANVCDANNWNVGGVEWTTDSKWDTLKRILQAGGARPTQTGAMIGCLVSMPRTAIATIESRHLLDSLSIAATKSRRDRFNSVIPRYVDENSDWSLISGTVISVPSYVTADRGQRTKEVDYPLVQVFSGEVAKQPGQLAAYDIVNSREAGPINFTTGPEWIGLKTGDVILLNVPEEGLINQPVLITRRAPDPSTGKVSFSAETETYAKHAYALGQSTTPPAPFSLVAPDLKPPAPALAQWAATGAITGEGLPAIVVTGNSEMPSADAVLIDYKLPADAAWTRSVILSAVDPVRHVIAPLKSETPYQVRVGYRVGQIDGEYVLLAATTGVGKLSGIEDGATNGMNPDERDILDQLEIDTAQAQIAIAAAQAQIQDIIDNGVEPPDLTALQAEVDALQASVGDIGTTVATLETTVSDHDASIVTNATAITGLTGSLATLSATVTSLDGSVTTLQSSYTGLSGTVSTLSSTVSAQGSSITTLQTASTTQAGQIASLSSTVSTQGASISSQATAITTLQGTSASLQTQINSTNASVSTNATAITTLNASVANLTQQVTAGGNPNLAPNGGFENGLVGYGANTGTWQVAVNYAGWGNHAYMDANIPDNSYALLEGANFPVEAGVPFAISADMRYRITGGTGLAYLEILWKDGAGTAFSLSGPAPSKAPNFDLDASGAQRKLFSYSGVAPTGAVQASARIVFYKQNGTVVQRAVRQIKVERGTVATPFSQEASVTQTFSTLSTLTTQYASLSSTVSTQGVTISTQQTAITTINGNVTTLFGQYVLDVTVGGLVAGMKLANNGSATSLRFQSDLVTFESSTGTGSRTEYSGGVWRVYAGAMMSAWGAPFGSSGQFVRWFGPAMALSACTEGAAVEYLKTNGDAYFGGALSAGTLRNSITGTSLASNASASLGPLGSLGHTRSIVLSYTWSWGANVASPPSALNPTATIQLFRGSNASGTLIATLDVGPGDFSTEPGPGGTTTISSSMSGSTTISDTSGGTTVSYFAQVSSRTTAGGNNGTSQRITIVTTET